MRKYIFQSIEEIKNAVLTGAKVHYNSELYFVKVDFEGDFIIKCTSSPMQELLTNDHKTNLFFINE